jgi:hypothetical protein
MYAVHAELARLTLAQRMAEAERARLVTRVRRARKK